VCLLIALWQNKNCVNLNVSKLRENLGIKFGYKKKLNYYFAKVQSTNTQMNSKFILLILCNITLFFILNTTSTNKRKRNQNVMEKSLTTENTIYFIKNEENILNFVEYKNTFDLPFICFRNLISYLNVYDLELKFKILSKRTLHLYTKFLREEKNNLKDHLTNPDLFAQKIKELKIYYNFFEKIFSRISLKVNLVEYVKVDKFCSNLCLLPKTIRQILLFKVKETLYKFIVFQNGDLLILKKHETKNQNYIFFDNIPKLETFNTNVRYIYFGRVYFP
jgi:hypothetical protein